MLHFCMTGRLAYFKDLKDDPEHDRLRLDFANGYHLAYVNQRLFGQAAIVEDLAQFVAEQELGPDAFANDLDEEAFQKLLAGRRGQVKSALMDQSLIAGLGNVYSDEILFKAHLHPKTPVNSLDRNVIAKLYRAMREVLRVSIDSGAGSEELFERLPDDYLLPHREEGDKCPVCDGEVQAIKASGRTAYYCPACQPLEREK